MSTPLFVVKDIVDYNSRPEQKSIKIWKHMAFNDTLNIQSQKANEG